LWAPGRGRVVGSPRGMNVQRACAGSHKVDDAASGRSAAPVHHHVHSEMWLIREGTVELTVNGTICRLGRGSAGFVHSNDEHRIKNVGTTPATYFVAAVGPGADS